MIDVKKLKEAIRTINHARKNGLVPVSPQYGTPEWKTYDWKAHWATARAVSTERATKLYSLRSHVRGTLHITKQWVQKDGKPRELVFRDLAWQEAFVADIVREFEMTEEQLKQYHLEQLRAKLTTEQITEGLRIVQGLTAAPPEVDIEDPEDLPLAE